MLTDTDRRIDGRLSGLVCVAAAGKILHWYHFLRLTLPTKPISIRCFLEH
jgi:hypothetical protein